MDNTLDLVKENDYWEEDEKMQRDGVAKTLGDVGVKTVAIAPEKPTAPALVGDVLLLLALLSCNCARLLPSRSWSSTQEHHRSSWREFGLLGRMVVVAGNP